jgi:hypothetical protein
VGASLPGLGQEARPAFFDVALYLSWGFYLPWRERSGEDAGEEGRGIGPELVLARRAMRGGSRSAGMPYECYNEVLAESFLSRWHVGSWMWFVTGVL